MAGQYMDNVVKAFFILLRAGLWERKPDSSSVFPLTRNEWEGVFDMARKQTVTALIYQGVCLLPESDFPPQDILLKWVSAVDVIERLNRKMNKSLEELYGMFVQNGLQPVLQKGQGVASFYKNPLSRECGDIDLYFPQKGDVQKAVDFVRKNGGRVSLMPDKSYNFRFRNTEIEIHPFLIDICNPFKGRYIKEIEESSGYVKMCLNGSKTEILVPTPFVNLLLLNTHILKHALGWGIGMRQLCDMAMACYSLNGSYSKEDMQYYCKKFGLCRWTRLLNAFMTDFLGLDEKYMLTDKRETSAEILKDIILEGGNFGMDRSGRKTEGKSKVMRKLTTMRSFCGNIVFSLKYAPAEGFWTFAGLLKGQF